MSKILIVLKLIILFFLEKKDCFQKILVLKYLRYEYNEGELNKVLVKPHYY